MESIGMIGVIALKLRYYEHLNYIFNYIGDLYR